MAKRFSLKFEGERCKGCELCVSVCPKHILELSGTINSKGYHVASVTDISECIGCQSCAVMCPDCVIEIYSEEATA